MLHRVSLEGANLVFLRLDAETITGVLTPAKVTLLRELHGRGPAKSLGELAKRVGRDLGAVSRDLTDLEAGGLVVKHRRGRSKEFRATGRPIVIRY